MSTLLVLRPVEHDLFSGGVVDVFVVLYFVW